MHDLSPHPSSAVVGALDVADHASLAARDSRADDPRRNLVTRPSAGTTLTAAMALPLTPPVLPQLARSRRALPTGDGWAYEPKWDGFRAIAFVDGDEVYLQSRNGKPLTRYFPELALAPAGRYVLDGEIVVHGGPSGLRRARPAHPPGRVADRPARRARRPRASSPSTCSPRDDDVLLELPYLERRAALEALVAEPSS